MLPDEIHETPEGTIRCPTNTPNSFLELSVSGASVMRRFVDPEGLPHGDYSGVWRILPARDVLSFYNWPQLREWFQKRGFNGAMLRGQEEAEAKAKADWKTSRRKTNGL